MGVRDRRDRERERRRQSILDAAERIYVTKGAGATMDEIAAEAEVAKGTLYLYVSSKEDLWLSLIGKALGILEERFRQAALLSADSVAKLRRIGEEYVRFSREHADLFRLLLDASFLVAHHEASPGMIDEVSRRSDRLWAVITGVLEEGIVSGVFRSDVSAFEMAIIFWSNTAGLLRQMDAGGVKDFRRHPASPYSLDRLDFVRLIDVSNALLLESLLTPQYRAGHPPE